MPPHEGGEIFGRLALNGLEHKARRTKKKGQLARPHDSSPVGKPCFVAHMAFLSRREGRGGFMTLLNKCCERGPVCPQCRV